MKYLVHTEYNRETDNPIYTFFIEETQQFERFVVPRDDTYSYFLQRGIEDTDEATAEEQAMNLFKTADPEAIDVIEGIERVRKYNLFSEEWETLLKINMTSAKDVEKHRFETCHEGHIRRITRHMLDKRWYMGMPYDENNMMIHPDVSSRKKMLIDMGYPEDVVVQMLEMMFAPIPDISFMSFDIECETYGRLHPNEMYASTPIISSAFEFYDREKGRQSGIVLMLDSELRKVKNHEKNAIFTELVTQGRIVLEIFTTEYDLVKRIIELLDDKRYPLILSYFGEGFDFPYLFNRAINLGINKRRLPFYCYKMRGGKRIGVATNWRTKMSNKMHIDLFQFFKQPSIKNYVFKGKYKKHGLEVVSQALLGRGKIEHVGTKIHEMSPSNLGYYNFVDANLTLDLLLYEDQLPLKIIFMLMRIGRQDYYEAAHRAIGNKILNLVQGYLVEHEILIPNHTDLKMVGEGHSNADIAGKGYRGAIVVPTEPGIWRDIKRVDFACFSDDTEILTENGWRSLYNIKNSDMVASVNIESKEIEFQQVSKIHQYDYNGDVFHYAISGGIDLIVTPNHRMVYRKRNRKDGRLKTASSLTWTDEWFIEEAQKIDRYWYSIPTFGVWNGKRTDINIGDFTFSPDQFLPFFGWLLSDGCITTYGNGRPSISISQKKKKNMDTIRSALKVLGVKYSESILKNNNGVAYTRFRLGNRKFCDALVKWIGGYPKSHEKYIPREILNFDSNSLQKLFDAMMGGDGSFLNRMGKVLPARYSTTSLQLASDFQELSLKLGYKCSISANRYNTSFGDQKYTGIIYYVIFAHSRMNVFNDQRPVSVERYSGRVWCVSVPNGTVIARRNGKVCVTGNSLYPTMMRERNLSFDTLNCRHPECKSNAVPELPHHVCTKRTGVFPTLIGCLKDIRLLYFKPWASDVSLSTRDRGIYKAIEQGIKVFVNASYGVGGFPGFGLFCKPPAESITAWARDALITLAVELENRHGNDLRKIADEHNTELDESEHISPLDALELIPSDKKTIIAGDTDSLMGLFTNEDVEFMVKLANTVLKTELALEIVAPLGIFHKKKTYILVDDEGEAEVKGMLGKKRNTPNIAVMCFKEFLELLKNAVLNEVDIDDLREQTIQLIRGYYDKIWRVDGDISDYVFEVQMTKSISSYETTPQHVKAAMMLVDHVRGASPALKTASNDMIVPAGSFIRYVKKASQGKGKPSCITTPIELATRDDISPQYYHDSLTSVMGQVISAMGIQRKDIMTPDPSQTLLEQFM